MSSVSDLLKDKLGKPGYREPVIRACLCIVDYVSALPPEQTKMLTYKTFANALGKTDVDQDLLAAVSLLTNSSPELHFFDLNALFIDEAGDEFELDAKDLAEALRSKEFVHPLTGKIVEGFAKCILPFFTPSDRIRN